MKVHKAELRLLVLASILLTFTCVALCVEYTDDFALERDFAIGQIEGTIWDGFLGMLSTEVADSSITEPGQLTFRSTDSDWDRHPPAGTGPFLYRNVAGDFTVDVEVTDWTSVDFHEVGLMARVADLDLAGTGEDYVAFRYTPKRQNLRAVSVNDDSTSTASSSGFYLHRYLQLERKGNTFYFRSRMESSYPWYDLVGGVIERSDLDGLELQVGIWQGTQNPDATTTATAKFDNFIIVESSSRIVLEQTDNETALDEAAPNLVDAYNVFLRGVRPVSSVEITIESDDQIAVDKSNLVFTPSDWDAPQMVTIRVVDDAVTEGPHTSVLTHTASGADSNYDGKTSELLVKIADDDRLGDLMRDGHINLGDIAEMAKHWLEDCLVNLWCDGADLTSLIANATERGRVDMRDFAALLDYWGQGPVLITEFMAHNGAAEPLAKGELLDGNGDGSDWIEIFNSDIEPVDLSGWYLTDDADNSTKWRFPEVILQPGEYFVLFASGRPEAQYVDGSGYLHTSFELGRESGYLAIVEPDGETVSHWYASYPLQFTNYSYGIDNGSMGYFIEATPGKANSETYMGYVADTKFSVDRGFYSSEFDLEITTDTPQAIIRYTTDGSTPTATSGNLYSGALRINKTTCIRAAAFKAGWVPTNVDTHTYLFVSDIIAQLDGVAPGVGWPTSNVNGQNIQYGMDRDVTNDGRYRDLMDDAMLAIPTLSLVTDIGNIFDPAIGIYVNPQGHGKSWERPVSAELIHPDSVDGFQIDAGLRIRGAVSRGGGNPKHSFRLFFRKKYGSGKLDYRLFGDEGGDSFDKVDLRCSQNYSWNMDGRGDGIQCRDVFSRDLQRQMGQPYTRSRYYHLYINGHYWGMYQTQERSEARYAAAYFGGRVEDYDVVKANSAWPRKLTYTDGNWDAYRRLWEAAVAGFESDEAYYSIQGMNPDGTVNSTYERLLDVDNLIVYLLSTYYVGDFDGPICWWYGNNCLNNFYGVYNRTNPDGFKFFRHDSEHTLHAHVMGHSIDRTGPWNTGRNFEDFNLSWSKTNIRLKILNYGFCF